MQIQSHGLDAGLIGFELAQAGTAIQVGVIQFAAILQTQHRVLSHHPPRGALTVRRQDIGHADRRGFRLIDHPVVGFGGCPVTLGNATKGAGWHLSFGLGHTDQSFTQPLITQWCIAKLVFSPMLPI